MTGSRQGTTSEQQVQVNTTRSSMQEKMAKKLQGARFRWLNEQLYTTTGKEAYTLLQSDPGIFKEVGERGTGCVCVCVLDYSFID